MESWKSIEDFRAFIGDLLDEECVDRICRDNGLERAEVETSISLYQEEAIQGLSFLREYELRPDQRVLEVGAGIGLLVCWLIKNGVDAYGLEPSGTGFEHNQRMLISIFGQAGVDPTKRLITEKASKLDPKIHGTFDFIFSLAVIEHIDDLDDTFSAMKKVGAPGCIQLHYCPNYRVPYEPHYGIALIPGFYELTGRLLKVQHEPMWRSLNFITDHRLKRMCSRLRLSCRLKPGALLHAFERLEYDPVYRDRHRTIARGWQVAAPMGLRFLLRHAPPSWSTPMIAEIREEA